MIKIAIIEDEKAAAQNLLRCIERFEEEQGTKFECTLFDNASSFLIDYRPVYDIVFMDIELPDINGMDAAVRLRRLDDSVTLIFVTNMAQFAIKGYEVRAFYFIVKPVVYANFCQKLQRAISHVEENRRNDFAISTQNGMMRIELSKLKYVEIMNHRIVYHMDGKNIESYGTLKKIEPVLQAAHFVRCNSCYLVNLKYITKIEGYTAFVGGEELKISQSRKKELIRALNEYLGEML